MGNKLSDEMSIQKVEKRKCSIDWDSFVISSGRTVEEIDNYIRELRDNDRI